MRVDRDGIVAVVLGLLILLGSFVFIYSGLSDPLGALISMGADLVKGFVVGTGLLLLFVGILFLTVW